MNISENEEGFWLEVGEVYFFLGNPSALSDKKVSALREAAQQSVQADGDYCDCKWNPLPAVDNGKCRACGKPRR